MSIEQHPGPAPERGPEPVPAEAGAALARLLHGLTVAVLEVADEPRAAPVEDVAPPARERRSTSLLSELSFLDD